MLHGFVSCSRPIGRGQVDPAFEPYVTSFEEFWGHKVHVNVLFDDGTNLQYPVMAGICSTIGTSNDKDETVYIRREFWEHSVHYWKEAVIFHELGHCVLGRQHNMRLFPSGEPYSIMFPDIFGEESFYIENRTHYINELFQRN